VINTNVGIFHHRVIQLSGTTVCAVHPVIRHATSESTVRRATLCGYVYMCKAVSYGGKHSSTLLGERLLAVGVDGRVPPRGDGRITHVERDAEALTLHPMWGGDRTLHVSDISGLLIPRHPPHKTC